MYKQGTLRKMLGLTVLLLTAGALAVLAQSNTATFGWAGSTDSSQLVELANINGQPVDQASGYAGAIQIVNGSFLWLLDLPSPLDGVTFPNNGYLDCSSPIAFGAKQWGTRPNGTKMDGTQAGDSYTLSGTTGCALPDGTTAISITEFRTIVAQRYCRYGQCRTFLVDKMTGGSGTVTVH